VHGMAALAAMTRSADAVIGDATNVAFRLSGRAGRQGRQPALVTSRVRRAAESQFVWGETELVEIKGRSGRETVFPVIARSTATTTTTTRTADLTKTSGGDLLGASIRPATAATQLRSFCNDFLTKLVAAQQVPCTRCVRGNARAYRFPRSSKLLMTAQSPVWEWRCRRSR
jgi:hypothetical protein